MCVPTALLKKHHYFLSVTEYVFRFGINGCISLHKVLDAVHHVQAWLLVHATVHDVVSYMTAAKTWRLKVWCSCQSSIFCFVSLSSADFKNTGSPEQEFANGYLSARHKIQNTEDKSLI